MLYSPTSAQGTIPPTLRFDSHLLVDRVSAYCQKCRLPFMGLFSFMGGFFTPPGVSHLQMAIYKDVDSASISSGGGFKLVLADVVGESY